MKNLKKIFSSYQSPKGGFSLAVLSTFLAMWKYPLTKLSLNTIPAPLAAFLECLLTVFFGWIHERQRGHKINFFYWDFLTLFCGVLNALGVITVFEALDRLHPVSVFLIGRIYYAYAFILAIFLLSEKPSKKQCLCLVTLLIGIFLSEWQNKFPESFGLSMVLALSWPFFFALQHAIVKSVVSKTKEQSTEIFIKSRLLSLAPIFFYLLFRQPEIKSFIPMDYFWLFLSTYFSIFLSTMYLFRAFESLSFITANLIRCCQPLGVLLISMALFPKPIELIHILGFILIVLSLLIFGLLESSRKCPQ